MLDVSAAHFCILYIQGFVSFLYGTKGFGLGSTFLQMRKRMFRLRYGMRRLVTSVRGRMSGNGSANLDSIGALVLGTF